MTDPRLRGPLLVTAGFAAGIVVGAGTLWLVQDKTTNSPTMSQLATTTPAPTVNDDVPQERLSLDPNAITVEYEVRTDGMSVTHLSYVDIVEGNPEMVELLGTPPPFSHVIRIPRGADFDLAALSVTGMGAATSSMTTCTLTIDGKRVARQSADGTYGLVNCALPASVVAN